MDELEKLRAENKALNDNLTATQERCSQLLTENRALKNQNATMKLRWLQLLEPFGWENGPDADKLVFHYSVDFDQDAKAYIIERDVSPEPHRCVKDGHSYGHGEYCHYCGHKDDT